MITMLSRESISLATKSQRAMAAARRIREFPRSTGTQREVLSKDICREFRCSTGYASWGMFVLDYGAAEVIDAVDGETISVATAKKLCSMHRGDKAKQVELLARGEAEIIAQHKAAAAARKSTPGQKAGIAKRRKIHADKRRQLEKPSAEILECWNCGVKHRNQEHGGYCCHQCVADNEQGWPQCCHCGKRYPRKNQHRERYCHLQCWKSAKRTTCPICSKKFTRRDVGKQVCCSIGCANRLKGLNRPCEHPGGSWAKVEVMRVRAELGLPIFHGQDSPECIEQHEEIDDGRIARRTGRKEPMSKSQRLRIIEIAMAEPDKNNPQIAERITGINRRQVQYVLRNVERPKPEVKPIREHKPNPTWHALNALRQEREERTEQEAMA